MLSFICQHPLLINNYSYTLFIPERIYMVPPKEEWPALLAKIRDQKYISTMDQGRQMTISHNTMKKILDNRMGDLALATLRKIVVYLEKEGY